MNQTTELAMTLARSALEEQAARIAALEEALRRYVSQDELIGLVNNDVYRTARALLNKETPRA